MPVFIGKVYIGSIEGGTVQFGDTKYHSPKSSTDSVNGSGAANNGGFVITNNGMSTINDFGTVFADQPPANGQTLID
ncbi:spore germination protein [Bacillus dakarensis]|uniref:spore germination protein n=1 Tax=Robertmurraya dakarensis TaxID=1926278 RepID=UPI0009811912|nr:spore germination protein [Bacillus dakarensis]